MDREQVRASLKNGTLAAWMPETEPANRAGVIAAPPAQEMLVDHYLTYLADRILMLLQESDNPQAALHNLTAQLRDQNLLHPNAPEPTMENLTTELFLSNPMLQDRLAELGVIKDLPHLRMPPTNPKAEQLLLATDLEAWLTALTLP